MQQNSSNYNVRHQFVLTWFIFQVPFDLAVKQVLEQLKEVAKGEHKTPDTEKRRFGNIVFAAVTLPVTDIKLLLSKVKKS